MNWYKRCQQVIDAPEDLAYTGLGHDVYHGDKPKEELNQMWIYYQGQLLVEPETKEIPSHLYAFDDDILDNATYTGRYNPYTGGLSIAAKTDIGRLRDIPDFLVRALKQRFPGVKNMYRF